MQTHDKRQIHACPVISNSMYRNIEPKSCQKEQYYHCSIISTYKIKILFLFIGFQKKNPYQLKGNIFKKISIFIIYLVLSKSIGVCVNGYAQARRYLRERERERVIMKRGVFCVVMGLGPTHKSTVHLKSDSQLTVPRCRLTDKFRRDFVSVIFFASSTPTIFFS